MPEIINPPDLTPLYEAIASVQGAMPVASSTAPAPIATNAVIGGGVSYARADHVHASTLRKARLQSAANGTITWIFDVPFPEGTTPRINAIAETGVGVTDVVNVQVEGTPTNTQANLRVTRTQPTVVAALSLTLLSVPVSVGVTWVHLSAAQS